MVVKVTNTEQTNRDNNKISYLLGELICAESRIDTLLDDCSLLQSEVAELEEELNELVVRNYNFEKVIKRLKRDSKLINEEIK